MYSPSFQLFAIILLLSGSTALALLNAPDNMNTHRSLTVKSSRDTNTCADPSLAETVFQAFVVQTTVHGLNFRPDFEHANTGNRALVAADQQPAFRAWPTQQNFTAPLFKLGSADRTQYIYKIGADAQTPPVVSGFNTDVGLIAWVYDSQVCGSVPLMSAVFAASTDRYFTTSAFEHNRLISVYGWVDAGVVAYVLPFYNC